MRNTMRLVDMIDGMVTTDKTGEKRIFIGGVFHNARLTKMTAGGERSKFFDYIVTEQDLTYTANPDKSIMKVETVECDPDANLVSEGMKYLFGKKTKRQVVTVWERKSKAVLEAEALVEDATAKAQKASADLAAALAKLARVQ
jgi:hypothetical protein